MDLLSRMRRVVFVTLFVAWAALAATVSAGRDDETPTGEPQAEEPRPQAVRFAPGERFDAGRGVYYLDVLTGAVEGWQFPTAPDVPFAPYPTSSSGRFIIYAVGPPTGPRVSADRLFDTRTGAVRVLTPGVFRSFAENDARYLEAAAGGIDILRTEDGVHERAVLLAHLGYAPDRLSGAAWSPSAEAVLVWWSVASAGGPRMYKLVHIDVATGHVTELVDGMLAQGGWSPDGNLYFIVAHSMLEARDALSGDTRWRLTAEDLGLAMPLKDGVEPLGGMGVPLYAPSGRSAVVLAAGADPAGAGTTWRVAVLDPESGTVRFWVENVLSCGRRWTADGRWLHVVGEREGEVGSFLVSEGGAQVRFLGRFVMDLSPRDPRLGVYRPFGLGEPSIAALDLETGESRPLAFIDGDWGWDTLHSPLWLADGRTVVHAPHPGHGGCGFYESPGDLAVRFPVGRPQPPPVPPRDPARVSGALLTANRDRLAICVQGVGDATAAVTEARERVEQALARVAQHPQFVPAGLGAGPPVVDIGCPHGPYLLEPGVFWEDGIPITGYGRTVEEASIYRLFVFLLPPEVLAGVIHGRHDIRRTAEEMLCQGHNCGEVTSGVYLTPDEINDDRFLVEWLTKGLGLDPTLPVGNAPGPAGR